VTAQQILSLFSGYGIEIEYMIVDRQTLDILPISDRLLFKVAGDYLPEVAQGNLAWSNELALHIIELKTNGPSGSLDNLSGYFQNDVRRINQLLSEFNGILMPSAMHPWMDPHTETRLWPHEYNPIYETYNRIFDCRGHGWSNLQSTHINLPFADDGEFDRLHAAIRLVLPLLPALAASSPVVDGRFSGFLDWRMEAYRNNSARIPQITGHVVPETVSSRNDYTRNILQPMYAAIAPLDPEGTLQHEWLNSRGAIARFDRNTIEVRVLDTQECPRADIAIAAAAVAVLKSLVTEHASSLAEQKSADTERLAAIFLDTVRYGGKAEIADHQYFAALGMADATPCLASTLWYRLLDATPPENAGIYQNALDIILEQGCLGERIMRAIDGNFSRAHLMTCYRELCQCLAEDRLFTI